MRPQIRTAVSTVQLAGVCEMPRDQLGNGRLAIEYVKPQDKNVKPTAFRVVLAARNVEHDRKAAWLARIGKPGVNLYTDTESNRLYARWQHALGKCLVMRKAVGSYDTNDLRCNSCGPALALL
jgi:hypothetical protein